MGSFNLRCIIAGFSALAFANAFTSIPPSQLQRSIVLLQRIRSNGQLCDTRNNISIRPRTKISLSAEADGDTGPKNASTSNNEFSRTIRISKWFIGGGGAGGSESNRKAKRRMDLSISTTQEERHALATRFRLTDISSLSADLVVQPALGVDGGGGGGGGQVDDGACIQAHGTISAEVTQICVRTNEEFDVSLEFSFDTFLKAMSSNIAGGSSDTNDEPLSEGEQAALEAAALLGDERRPRKNKNKGGKKRGVKGVRGGQAVDDMGMKQLRDILQEYEVTDEIIEDEACFCTDGIVDCGEIVAQMFRSKLDPYPKKPGSDPVSYSFTF